MHPARIAELLAPFLGTRPANDRSEPALSQAKGPLTSDAPPTGALYQHISTYIDILLRWNARINLTAIRNPEDIVTRHFGESLFAARHLFPPGEADAAAEAPGEARSQKPEARLADLGSGAGFPGLPIKLWSPHIALTLIESNHKKAAFLREVIRALTLTNVNVLTARAETLVDTHPPSDVVTLRAVERFETILPIAARLVASTGRLAVLIGSSQLSELASLTPKLTWNAPSPVPQSDSRVLSISVPH